jgi:enoyl-[acyl-carrier protein] reductase I
MIERTSSESAARSPSAARPALLAGRRGVVIGVSSERSLGYACARTAYELGAEVALTYRPARRGVVGALAAGLGDAIAAPLDVDAPSSIAELFALLEQRWGRVDFVIHTLMHVPDGVLERPLTDVDRTTFARVLDIGVHSLVAIAGHARPLLARSAAPRLVALSSPCGRRMTPHYHVAGIAKAALESTLLYLAQELGPDGILCNAVSPALVDTDGAVAVVGRDSAAATRVHLARKAATRRAVELDDIADCVAWLCSPWARQITGEVVTIDGGYSRNYF